MKETSTFKGKKYVLIDIENKGKRVLEADTLWEIADFLKISISEVNKSKKWYQLIRNRYIIYKNVKKGGKISDKM